MRKKTPINLCFLFVWEISKQNIYFHFIENIFNITIDMDNVNCSINRYYPFLINTLQDKNGSISIHWWQNWLSRYFQRKIVLFVVSKYCKRDIFLNELFLNNCTKWWSYKTSSRLISRIKTTRWIKLIYPLENKIFTNEINCFWSKYNQTILKFSFK